MEIRRAEAADVDGMCAIDAEDRRSFIERSQKASTAHVAIRDGAVVGYAVLEHSFFERGFISMLMVGPAHRRSGVGGALIRHVERHCASERIFTSTNRSNLPMQALLKTLGYTHSGTVDDLDPGDPELFYSRQLGGQQPGGRHRG